MTVDLMGKWTVIVEAANTYSPDPARKASRVRLEQEVYRQRGVMIAPDYLVNSGGVLFAIHEKLIKAPNELRIPQDMLGNREAVDGWLLAHAAEFATLAEARRAAAEIYREGAMRRNMRELVDLLSTNVDMLPCQAAEKISLHRIDSMQAGSK